MSVLMWEVRAAPGRLEELVAAVCARADPSAQVLRSSDPDERVVLIDPSGRGVSDLPEGLLARPAHEWTFDPVERDG